MRLQGLHPGGRPGPVRPPADHSASCSTSSSSTSRVAAATGSRSSRSAGTTSAGRGCAPRLGLALRVAWDLFRIPLLHRRVVAARLEPRRWRSRLHRGDELARDGVADRRGPAVSLGRRGRRGSLAARRGHARLRLPGLRQAAAAGCSTASRCTTRRSTVAGGFAIYLYPPPFALAFVAVRAAARRRRRSGPGRRCCSARARRRRGALLPVSPDGPLVDRAAGRRSTGRSLYSVKLGQVGPDPVPAVRARLALAGPAGRAARRRSSPAASMKVQPLALAGWALLTGRVRAAASSSAGWRSSGVVSVLRPRARRGRPTTSGSSPGQRAGHDAAQLHARRGRLPGRRRPRPRRRPSSGGGRGAGRRVAGRDPVADRRGVVPRRGRRHPARLAAAVGPLRDACCCCRSPGCSSAASGGRSRSRSRRRCRCSASCPRPSTRRIRDLPARADRRRPPPCASTSPAAGRVSVAVP